MAKLVAMLVILVLGAVFMAPVVMAFDPDPMPGDFALLLAGRHIAVPVVWSLCASGVLALFYAVLKR